MSRYDLVQSSSKENNCQCSVWDRLQLPENNFSCSLIIVICQYNFNLSYTVPAVVYPLENIAVTEDENRTLTCNVSGSPTRSVTWTEVKTGIRSIGITRQLTHINRNESGEYKCEASNSCGNDTKSAFLIVQCKWQYLKGLFSLFFLDYCRHVSQLGGVLSLHG